LLEKDKRRCLTDLIFLSHDVLNYPDVGEKFHYEIAEKLKDKSVLKWLFLLPRKHLKTTLITVSYVIQQILSNPDIRVLIVNAVWDNARKMLSEIKAHLEKNQELKLMFGNFQGKKWGEDEIIIAQRKRVVKESTIATAGTETEVTSGHFDLIILDDLVTWANVKTRDQIDKIIDAYKYCLDLLETGGELIIEGTRYDYSELYGWILKYFKEDFQIITREMKEKGQYILPSKFNKKIEDELKREQGTAHFYAQYYNKIIAEEDQLFRPGDIQYISISDVKEIIDDLDLYLTVDPASSLKKNSDYSAYVLVGKDYKNNWYVIEAEMKRLNPAQRVDNVFNFNDRHKLIKSGIEVIGFQETMKFYCEEKMRTEGKFFIIEELKPKFRSKQERIKALQPRFHNHTIFILNTLTELEYQLLHFPKCEFDDLLDALAYQLDLQPSLPKSKEKDERLTPRRSLEKILEQSKYRGSNYVRQ